MCVYIYLILISSLTQKASPIWAYFRRAKKPPRILNSLGETDLTEGFYLGMPPSYLWITVKACGNVCSNPHPLHTHTLIPTKASFPFSTWLWMTDFSRPFLLIHHAYSLNVWDVMCRYLTPVDWLIQSYYLSLSFFIAWLQSSGPAFSTFLSRQRGHCRKNCQASLNSLVMLCAIPSLKKPNNNPQTGWPCRGSAWCPGRTGASWTAQRAPSCRAVRTPG